MVRRVVGARAGLHVAAGSYFDIDGDTCPPMLAAAACVYTSHMLFSIAEDTAVLLYAFRRLGLSSARQEPNQSKSLSVTSYRLEQKLPSSSSAVYLVYSEPLLIVRNRKGGPGCVSYSYLRMGAFHINFSMTTPEFLIFL